jgi:hypothetical protein
MLYILLAVPTLAWIIFLMVTGLPRLLMTTGDSYRLLGNALSQAYDERDLLRAATVLLLGAMLALPVLGSVYLLYSITSRLFKAAWIWSRTSPARRIVTLLGSTVMVSLVMSLWLPQLSLGRVPADVQVIEGLSRTHVIEPVTYAQVPPVGGDHAPVWQNCQFYDRPIVSEYGVHSLEHGAVWITYRSDLPRKDVDLLRRLSVRQPYILVSPYPDLPAPVVASAWGRQLYLDSATDRRLDEFVRAFRLGDQAPERGGGCTGGIDTPR